MPADSAPASIWKHSGSLGLFALLAAILLAVVHSGTLERIQAQQLAAERRALAAVMPADMHDNDLLAAAIIIGPRQGRPDPYARSDLLQLTQPRTAYIARRDENFAGAILPVEAHDGYSGDILVLVGVLADGRISGVRVLAHQETPGLGDKIDAEISDWILGFNSKSLVNPPPPRWQVVKDGGDFDQLVGATVTPRAVVNAVMRALQFFETNQQLLANP